MGNGPSLNLMDLNAFEGENVWATNRAHLVFDRISWRPKFWVAVDRRVVPDIAPELVQVQHSLPDTLFFYPDEFLLKGVLPSLPNTRWFREKHDPNRIPHGVFSRDVSRYVSSVKTVTITAIQLAVHLGFNPIYLFGCDTSYRIPDSAVRGRNPEHLTSTADDDPNHFVADYFGKESQWHDPHVDRMIEHYGHVHDITRDLGTQVINATVGGALEVFPREDYTRILATEPDRSL